MPALGILLPHNFAWRSLHDLSANLFLVLLGLHTALHWNWIVDASSSSAPATTDRFEPGNGRSVLADGASPGFQNGGLPPFPREGEEFHRKRSGVEWLFEALKNIAIIGVIDTLTAIPKSWMQ